MGKCNVKIGGATTLILTLLISGCERSPIGELSFPDGVFQHVVISDEIDWRECPGNFPAGCQIAVLEGNPQKPNLFTVLKGQVSVAFGLDGSREVAKQFGPGDYYVNAQGAVHTVWIDEESEIQITGVGPWDDGPYSSYTVPNLIAHMIERVTKDQRDVAEIHLMNPKIFGLDAENALLTASLNVHLAGDGFHIPQIYGFALRTDDSGKKWTQVFDPVDRRIPPITDVRFIGTRGLLLYEISRAGNRFGFFYSQDWGHSWIDSELDGISGSYHLVGWSVRKPHEGVAVVASDSGIPIDGDNSRETAYWVIRTPGGFRWTIDEVVERGYERGFVASDYLFPSEWDQLSELWEIRQADDFLSVVNNGIVVLQLSMNRVWSRDITDR